MDGVIAKPMYNVTFINSEKFPRLAAVDVAFGPESRKVDDPVKLEDVLENKGVKDR
jgi:hypothetical protein